MPEKEPPKGDQIVKFRVIFYDSRVPPCVCRVQGDIVAQDKSAATRAALKFVEDHRFDTFEFIDVTGGKNEVVLSTLPPKSVEKD